MSSLWSPVHQSLLKVTIGGVSLVNIFFSPCQSNNWEVMNDLHQMEICSVPSSSLDLSIPGICEGYLMKRRKYPLKGWHKVSTL